MRRRVGPEGGGDLLVTIRLDHGVLIGESLVLVFLDESGVNSKMARTHGRAPKGQHLVASVTHGHWKTLTFIAALRHDRIDAPWVLDGPMDGEAFKTYLREELPATLGIGDLVTMNNLPAHKVAGVREIIESAGAKLLYLPPYSPDLNPI